MIVFQECQSATGWQEVEVPSSDPAKQPYILTIPPWDRGDTSQVSCSCPSYLNRGWCRHQREAYSYVCGWSGYESVLEQTNEQMLKKVCPECGGPTRVVVEED